MDEQGNLEEVMLTRNEMMAAYAEYPMIISNTEGILNDCRIEFVYGKFSNKNLKHYTGSASGDVAKLRSECEVGLKYRYRETSKMVLERVEKELRIIEQMDYSAYFLINWDIITYVVEVVPTAWLLIYCELLMWIRLNLIYILSGL